VLLALIIASAALPVSHVKAVAGPASPNDILSSYVGDLRGFRYVGPLPGNINVTGVLYVPLRDVPLIFYYAQAVSVPGSPLYGTFLSPSQASRLFIPGKELREAEEYLSSHGISVLLVAGSMIVFSGPASRVEKALGASIGVFSNGTESYYAVTEYGGQFPWPVPYISNITGVVLRTPKFLLTSQDLVRLRSLYGVNISYPEEVYPMTSLAGAYNATCLYSLGDEGQRVNVGIVDFYGDPTLYQDIAYYDSLVGLPRANITVVPIGPYDPNLGVLTGWNVEVDLDVEAVHSMAPMAHIYLYVAGGVLPLSAVIAYIDQRDNVSIVSQSFGIPESEFSYYGFSFYYYNVYLADVYYALGAAEGITFLAASGDGGGMGYSAGPVGDVSYPASSPWVLAVGGTTTYLNLYPNGSVSSYYSTAWSAAGFVPYMQNFGGSTGGYSAYEPMPWWQEGVVPTPPQGFPYGRAVPDVSANANIFPGAIMVTEDNETVLAGGTSEASQLTAGLLALVEEYVGHRLGLVAPTLYSLYSNSSTRNAFIPITFGYNIPWAASNGYNLVTGLGAINAGNLARHLSRSGRQGLSIEVLLGNVSQFIASGTTVNVSANITYRDSEVVSGSFTASLELMNGTVAEEPMYFNSTRGLWEASLHVPLNSSGPAFIEVSGSYNGSRASYDVEVFVGYFGNMPLPTPMYPYLPYLGMPLAAFATSPAGTPGNVSMRVDVLRYNPLNNTYTEVYSQPIGLGTSSVNFTASPGYYIIKVSGQAYGLTPIYVGYLMQLFILAPQVLSMPGAVPEGGFIAVEGVPVPPIETTAMVSSQTGFDLFDTMLYGSNVTVSLVSPAGGSVASSQVPLTASGLYYGLLQVPRQVRPGLYWVLLNASYNSTTLGGLVKGYGVDMIYVGQPLSAQVAALPPIVEEGGRVTVEARITYQNGTPVRYGLFSATILPASLRQFYENASQQVEVPLYYNSTLGLWVGQAYLPGPSSIGNASPFEVGKGEEWYIVVTGVSPFGDVLAYSQASVVEGRVVYYANEVLSPPFEAAGAMFNNVTIEGYSGNITWSYFKGVNHIDNGTLGLEFDDVEGELIIYDSVVTMSYVSANEVVLIDSRLYLRYSSVGRLILGPGSNYTSSYSTVGSVGGQYQIARITGWVPQRSAALPSSRPYIISIQQVQASQPQRGRATASYMNLAVAATAAVVLAVTVLLLMRRSSC
ncbi:MAG: protease pro-enzyme activation domain-containing protein, partial [Acidilobus sp.]